MYDRTLPNFSAYLLQLEGENKFYAGSTLTKFLKKRYDNHVRGKGSLWTSTHPPVRIIQTWDKLSSLEAFDKEQSLTEELILKYQDLETCRGGRWNFPPETIWWVPERFRFLVK